jgi:hypothetical protein
MMSVICRHGTCCAGRRYSRLPTMAIGIGDDDLDSGESHLQPSCARGQDGRAGIMLCVTLRHAGLGGDGT